MQINSQRLEYYIIPRLSFSGNSDLLGDLMSSLRWLVSSVQYGDANTVLANYREYKCKVSEQVGSSLRWLVSSVQYGDANTVLANYREYKCKVSE